MKKGYKQTELGLIPEDWEVKTLGEIGKFSKGSGIKKDEAQSGDIPCIRYGELYTRHSNYIKQFYSFISQEISETAKKLKFGDILFAGSGETKEEIGKSVAFIGKSEAYAGGDIVILSPINAEPLYLGYLLNAPVIQKQKANRGQGDAVVHISANQLGSIKIPLPPTLAEQRAIAAALSDADALIDSLEKLIAKKRDIKQGAMQRLLAPKEGWERKKLGEVVWFQEGPGVRNYQFTSSGVKLLNGTNIENGKLILDKTDRYISENEAFGWYSHFLVDSEDILIACSGVTIDKFDEKVTIANKVHLPLCMNTSTMRFKIISPSLFKGYFFHFLKSQSFKQQIGGKATGSAQLNFGPSHVKMVEISIPDFSEQTRIASVLSDMDAEIAALSGELEKYKGIKAGMMQELLTGRVRLG